MRITAIVLVFLLGLTANSEARPRRVQAQPEVTFDLFAPILQTTTTSSGSRRRTAKVRSEAIYQAHPPGCPRRAFCGCGASAFLFGTPVRNLFLASNWLKLPRATPAPRMAAARRGHVFVLLEHREGSVWKVYDANSGGGKTRIHYRSIAGFTIVNPNA